MVKWRRLKEEQLSDMLRERRLLEKDLQLRVMKARVEIDRLQVVALREAYHQSIVEVAALSSENMSLREAIEQQSRIEAKLQQDAQDFLKLLNTEDSLLPLVASNYHGEAGWRVHFPNNEPSFYFTPFTRDEYDGIFARNDFADRHPCTATVGTILGWTIHFTPLTQTAPGVGSFMVRARFTRCVRCSLDESERILPSLDKNLWPMNMRYLVLAQHIRQKQSDGKRADKYSLIIGDSETNACNREVQGPRHDVQWVLEGGICITISEVDESTIDVEFDQWAGCLSESHGRELYIDWIKFPVRLEQCISPTRLLRI
ncbi:unnamed protein product [Phytophthora fragariaefolia]|uniref:Unnamed protein product n=1 Tax=Phytophthora fragariaefolia TaxID=1490495 RepID=A0A9W6XJN8_9STRA|nr:unnamed protein product [Phytophthora fragariaefolia]